MMNYATETVRRNAEHRKDMNWVKVGPKEYMNSLGFTIKYDHNAWLWRVRDPQGNVVLGSYKVLWAAKEFVQRELDKAFTAVAAIKEAETVLKEAWESI